MAASGTILGALGKAAATAAVLVGLALAKKFAKPPADPLLPDQGDVALPSDFLVNLSMVLVCVLLALATHAALVAGNRFFATRSEQIELILYPSRAIWWFFPGFAALCLSWEILLRLWILFAPEQANAYRRFSAERSGFDSTRVLRWLAVLIVLPIGLLTLLALPIHTTLTRTGIDQGHFASLTREFLPFAAAQDLTLFDGYTLRNGSFQPRAGLLIRFNDGRSWNSADVGNAKATVDPRLLGILTRDTGLPLRHVHIQPQTAPAPR
jgi:hypothetical protein